MDILLNLSGKFFDFTIFADTKKKGIMYLLIIETKLNESFNVIKLSYSYLILLK